MGATGRSHQATYDQRARPSSMEALITEAMGGFEFEWILRRQCTRSSVARSDAGHRGLAEPKRWSHQGGVPLIQFLGWWARELGLCQPNPANSCFSSDQLELFIEFWPVLVKFQLAYWADSFPMF